MLNFIIIIIISTVTGLPHIHEIIEARRTWLGYQVSANHALKFVVDINANLDIPQSWRRPLGRPRP